MSISNLFYGLNAKFKGFILKIIAYYILEPRFRSGKWQIRKDCLESLRPDIKRLYALFDKAQDFFVNLNICSRCSGSCCYGAYNRFTVYDYIAGLINGSGTTLEWRYRLHPLWSYALNRVDKGICSYFVEGKGCSLGYTRRPAICILFYCDIIAKALTNKQRQFLIQLKHDIDDVHWKFAKVLLSGCMKRKE